MTGADDLLDFFEWFWGEEKGFVYLPVESNGHWEKNMFSWPRQKLAVVRYVLKHEALGHNVFFAPALFERTSPKKDSVKGTRVLWVDFDGNAPAKSPEGVPEPQMKNQSSISGHEHWYWMLDEFLTNIATIDDRNRALAYTMGADTSGWDADQILRPLGTTNRKRGVPVKNLRWIK